MQKSKKEVVQLLFNITKHNEHNNDTNTFRSQPKLNVNTCFRARFIYNFLKENFLKKKCTITQLIFHTKRPTKKCFYDLQRSDNGFYP